MVLKVQLLPTEPVYVIPVLFILGIYLSFMAASRQANMQCTVRRLNMAVMFLNVISQTLSHVPLMPRPSNLVTDNTRFLHVSFLIFIPAQCVMHISMLPGI